VNSVNKILIYSFIFRPNISRTDFYVTILVFEELNEINKMCFIFICVQFAVEKCARNFIYIFYKVIHEKMQPTIHLERKAGYLPRFSRCIVGCIYKSVGLIIIRESPCIFLNI
jgi:hypothetical protein